MFALNALCIVLSSFFTAWCVGFPFTGALSSYPLQNLKRWYMYNPNDDDDDSLFEDYRAAEIIKHSGLLIILIGQVNNYVVTINIWNDSFGNLKRNQSLRSVAHCSRSQDIALFKFQLSYHSNPLQDTCPITSAVLGHLIRTRVPLMFLNWDKKSYQLCEKCATLTTVTPSEHQDVSQSRETRQFFQQLSVKKVTVGFF